MTWPEAFTTVGIAMAGWWWCIRFAAGVDVITNPGLYFRRASKIWRRD